MQQKLLIQERRQEKEDKKEAINTRTEAYNEN